MFVCCECCVLSGRVLCDELITRPEESYRLCCVVVCDLETSKMRRPWPALGRSATAKKKKNRTFTIYVFDKRCGKRNKRKRCFCKIRNPEDWRFSSKLRVNCRQPKLWILTLNPVTEHDVLRLFTQSSDFETTVRRTLGTRKLFTTTHGQDFFF